MGRRDKKRDPNKWNSHSSENNGPRPRLIHTATVVDASQGFIDFLNLPKVPRLNNKRIRRAIEDRRDSLMDHLRASKDTRLSEALEIRLIRDALSVLLLAYELQIHECEVFYYTFKRELLPTLGYESTSAGFRLKHRAKVHEDGLAEVIYEPAELNPLTQDGIDSLNLPEIPEVQPKTIKAIKRRASMLFYHLPRNKQQVPPILDRLVRESQRVVCSAYCLAIPEASSYYSQLVHCADLLGFERTEVGFKKKNS